MVEQRQALVDGYEQNIPRNVLAIQRFITEAILNLRCPNCRKTFHDHTDCPSVTCHNCSSNFCARCVRMEPLHDMQ